MKGGEADIQSYVSYKKLKSIIVPRNKLHNRSSTP